MSKEQLERFEIEIEKLKDDLKKISNDLSEAADIDNVFWQVQAIIANNPAINHNDVFQEWILTTYIDSVAIRIRRLIDKRRGTISLWRLLDEMKQYSTEFSRSRYLNMHESYLKSIASTWFDNLAGKGKDHIRKAKIEAKKREIVSAYEKIEDYINTWIAHCSETPSKKQVTLIEVRKTLVSFYNVLNWCYALISCAVLSSPVPQQHSNWLRYFRIPWLEPGSKIPLYKHLDEYINESEKT